MRGLTQGPKCRRWTMGTMGGAEKAPRGRRGLAQVVGDGGLGFPLRRHCGPHRSSQIITDKGRAVGNPGSCPGNGESGEKAGSEASHGSFDCQAEAFAAHSLSSGGRRRLRSWERHQNWSLGGLIQRPRGEGGREVEDRRAGHMLSQRCELLLHSMWTHCKCAFLCQAFG